MKSFLGPSGWTLDDIGWNDPRGFHQLIFEPTHIMPNSLFCTVLILACCFQLNIRKKMFGVSRIFEKHPIPKDRWHIYQTKYFFTEIRSLEKKFMLKKFFKNLLFSNCDLWSLPNQISQKQKNLHKLGTQKKKNHACGWK